MTTEEIHPRDIEPLHCVVDVALYGRLVESMWAEGWQGRPLLVAETEEGLRAITGSHRLAAAQHTGTYVPCYVVRVASDQLERLAAGFQLERLAILREIGDAEAIALFEREIEEGR